MYYIQDAHSFWDWIYFVCLIVIGSFFMINLCLVVIATQFSETKKRETERMLAERRRFSRSSSTLVSDEPGSCWEETIKYLERLWRRASKHLHIWWKTRRRRRAQVSDGEREMKRPIESRAAQRKSSATRNSPSIRREELRRIRVSAHSPAQWKCISITPISRRVPRGILFV